MHAKSNFFHQFLQLAGPYWNSKNKWRIRLETLLFLALTVMQIILAVYTTQWNAALFDAIEQRSTSGVQTQIVMLLVLFAASITITTSHLLVKRRLMIGWRSWLTEVVMAKWMHQGRHYQISLLGPEQHDNPDGRIAEDIRIATEEAISLFHSMFYCLLMLVSFTKILWDISGRVIFDFDLFSLSVSGYLVWIAICYSICASVLGWWMGQPMRAATHARQAEEANFRHELIDIQANSQAIALIKGEAQEQSRLLDHFHHIVTTFAKQTKAWKRIQMFSSGYSITSMALPILVASPRYIAGAITLGPLVQSVQAFQHMVSALSWPVDNLAPIALWRTSAERVVTLASALEHLNQDGPQTPGGRIQIEAVEQATISLKELQLFNVTGEALTVRLHDELKPGERIVLVDQSKHGAKLFKAIAGLWPWGMGAIHIPKSSTLFFMSPKPYLPKKTLFEALCYPLPKEQFALTEVEELMVTAGQAELIPQLNQIAHWESSLSNEQLQLLGLIRVLLHRPQWLFIQEALDSLTPEDEARMLKLLVERLPETGILTLTHQPVVVAVHSRSLTL